MGVHERSPLSEIFLDFYKDGTSKFRKEIDNKVMKQTTDSNSSRYTALLSVLNQGKESTNLAKMKSKISSNKVSSMNVLPKNKHVIEEELESDTQSYGDEDQIKRNKRRPDHLMDIDSLESKSDADSNSTDYGIDEAEKILSAKPELLAVKATEAVEKAVADVLKFDFTSTFI